MHRGSPSWSLNGCRSSVEDAHGDATLVLFTAHSLPTRVVDEGSDYPAQLSRAAEKIAALAGVERYLVCWQSAGRTQDEWLGPDLLDVLGALDTTATRDVVVCPVGFVSDHLEVLFDVDVEARGAAEGRGISLRRTPSLNADPAFVELLAAQIVSAAT